MKYEYVENSFEFNGRTLRDFFNSSKYKNWYYFKRLFFKVVDKNDVEEVKSLNETTKRYYKNYNIKLMQISKLEDVINNYKKPRSKNKNDIKVDFVDLDLKNIKKREFLTMYDVKRGAVFNTFYPVGRNPLGYPIHPDDLKKHTLEEFMELKENGEVKYKPIYQILMNTFEIEERVSYEY